MQRLARQRRRVVDFVLPDVRRLRQELAAPERVAMDQYLSSLESIESRLRTLEAQEPIAPPSVACGDAPAASFADIAPLAVACGLTRVATIYVKERNHNSWWHGTTPRSWYAENAANILRIWQRLTELGVAQDSAILWFAKNGGGHHRSSHRLQAMVVGNLGGALGPGGRHLSFEGTSKGAAGGQHVQSLFYALAHSMDPSIESFAGYSEPLPGLLA